MEVYCVQVGDCVECGANLQAIHKSYLSAYDAAKAIILEKEEHWKDELDRDDWRYIEKSEECVGTVVKYWQTKGGHDIVIVTKHEVLR